MTRPPTTSLAPEVEALIAELHGLLHEVFAPVGALIVLSAPNRRIDGMRPCDAIRDRDADALQRLCAWLNTCADGNFA